MKFIRSGSWATVNYKTSHLILMCGKARLTAHLTFSGRIPEWPDFLFHLYVISANNFGAGQAACSIYIKYSNMEKAMHLKRLFFPCVLVWDYGFSRVPMQTNRKRRNHWIPYHQPLILSQKEYTGILLGLGFGSPFFPWSLRHVMKEFD